MAPEQVTPPLFSPFLLPFQVDYLCAGTVQQEVRTSNIAKEAAFISGIILNLTPPHLQFQPRSLPPLQDFPSTPLATLSPWLASRPIRHYLLLPTPSSHHHHYQHQRPPSTHKPQAVTSCMGLLATGQAEVAIAGGVEFCSDQPIR